MADQIQKDSLKAKLAALGGTAGNGRLREALGWDEATYEGVKAELLADGVVIAGRGRGGSLALAHLAAALAAPVPAPPKPQRPKTNGGDLGFEAELFKAADKLRGNMEPSDYKHVALGLIFVKHISDSFEAKRAELLFFGSMAFRQTCKMQPFRPCCGRPKSCRRVGQADQSSPRTSPRLRRCR